MTKNNYQLIAQTGIVDVEKLVQDIAQIFFLQFSKQSLEQFLLIELLTVEACIVLRLTAVDRDNRQLLVESNIELSGLNKSQVRHQLKRGLFVALAGIYQERQDDWGILSGVRPIKLVQMLMDKGLTNEQVYTELCNEYLLHEPKANLAIQIASRQNQLLENYDSNKDICVYVGVPYCNSKCTYCSFPSGLLPKNDLDTELFLQTIEQDVKNVIQLANEYELKIRSLYIGGGTPTSFKEKHFTRFIDILRPLAACCPLEEFTFEAGRVDSLSEYKLSLLQELGITRISLNPQTFNEQTLITVGRNHTVADFCLWYDYVRSNFSWQINMDIILGLPGEGLAAVQHTLSEVRRLAPDSLTVHVLAFKKDAALFNSYEEYFHNNALIGQMLELSSQTAAELNLAPYYLYRQGYILGNQENVGYARNGFDSLYNIMIMREKHTIIGIGPSAKTKLVFANNKIETFFMPKNINVYIEKSAENFAKRKLMLDSCFIV